MNNTTTRIADLPENATIQSIDGGGITGGVGGIQAQQPQLQQQTYQPINMMPSNQIQNNMQENQELIKQQQMQSHFEGQNIQMQQHYEEQMQQQQFQMQQLQQQLATMQQQRLPSRDIPKNTLNYMQDEETKPNYIPNSDIEEDFVRKKEIMNEKKLKEHEDKKKNASFWDTVWSEFQTPIFIIILFFLFQMPIINTMIFKKFSFLSITKEDGNFNTNGLICKSVLFGALYYLLSKILKYIVEL